MAEITTQTSLEVGKTSLRLLSCTLKERLDTLPELVAEASQKDMSDKGELPDPDDLIGKVVKFNVRRVDGSDSRDFVGVALGVDRMADADGIPFLRIVASPRLAKLAKRADCRTFQNLSVPDIVKSVLATAGIADLSFDLQGTHAARLYVVQYRETDLHFIQRLLAEEGIYYSFRYEDGVDKVVFGDDPSGLGEIPAPTKLSFKTTFGFSNSQDHANHIERTQEIRTDRTTLRDYDLERPKFTLETKATGKDPGDKSLEVYDYPGRFTDQNIGQSFVQTLLDSIQCERDILRGEVSTMRLETGLRFELTDHAYEPMNGKYMVVGVEIEARERRSFNSQKDDAGREFVCKFIAVPSENAYRPPRIARAVAVPGAQRAVVTGPSGSEIHSDGYGRVKAQFFWDRLGKPDDTSSTWMRTSQLQNTGSMLLPRVGWEIAVDYLEGDPDKPCVMSRFYNAEKTPPYSLPGGKARSSLQTFTSPGGVTVNEFRTDDSSGQEEFYMNASKDMTVDVVHNATEQIGNDETHHVGSNQTVEVTNSITATIGGDQSTSIGGNQTWHVETKFVDQCGSSHEHDIGGNRSLSIGGDHHVEVGGSGTVKVGSIKTDLVVGPVTEKIGGNETHEVGAALVAITTDNRPVIVAGNHTESTGALKAIITASGRGVDVGGALLNTVAGAILSKVGGDKEEHAGAMYTEVVAGARILKADKIIIKGEALVTIVMGASTITLTPASISIAGISIKIDGATDETAALVMDN